MEVTPTAFGHVWEAPENPSYDVRLENRAGEPQEVTITVETLSADGEESVHQQKKLTVPAGGVVTPRFDISVEKNGYHDIVVSMERAGTKWVEERSFVRLAKDTRAEKGTGEGLAFSYWSYHGGHYTPPGEEIKRLMRMAGGRAPVHPANAWPITPQWDWAGEDPLNQEAYEQYKKEAVKKIRQRQGENPELITFFPEPGISLAYISGSPSYWGEPRYELNEKEKHALRVFFNTSKAAAEGVREEWPNARILIPWGDALFIVPLLRAGFPKELIDGSGLDSIGFERLPERQLHSMSTHRLYILREEYRKFGMPDPHLIYVEGIFVPTEPGACTWQGQADRHDRWALISLAYGVKEFYSGWFAFDCGDYYGTEHYGGCGIQRRIPYCNPKHAYAQYGTMTRMLDGASFEKWLPTGSLTTYCLKFDRPQEKGGPVHALWTIRGRRPATLTLRGDATVTVTDANDNPTPLESENRTVTVMTSPSVIYIEGVDEIESVAVGAPDHSESVEWARGRNRRTWQTGPLLRGTEVNYEAIIASLGDGAWSVGKRGSDPEEVYRTNHFETVRYPGKMAVSVVEDPDRGPALAVKLLKQDKERQLMPWYSAIEPEEPIAIPGKSLALGLWVKGASDWGRVVYCLRDANDEMWISVGGKDQWNCDDGHSWSSFNFDGWRYVRFELPSHVPYDNFREYGTTWWRYAGGKAEGVGVVDLPLRLEKIIVERRTHILYVNDIQLTHAEENDVLLGDLIAEYETEWHATDEVVKQSRIRMPLPEAPAEMANPIAEMRAANPLAPTKLVGVRDPDWGYDGTRCHVQFEEVEGAAAYQVWVAAHEDGRGAAQMAEMQESGGLVQRLAPGLELYLWVTYTTEQGEGEQKESLQSKPSNVLKIQLVDSFGMK